MSFDKHYPRRKDWRKPYRGSKRFDRSCRNHGMCGWCEGNRTIAARRAKEEEEIAMSEYKQCTSSLTPHAKGHAKIDNDGVNYEQTTTSIKNVSTKDGAVNSAREGYQQTTSKLNTGTKK